MKMSKPYFSVIIPAHNSETFIEKALKSVTDQSYQNYELIVVCDACSDHTEDIARLYTDDVYAVDFGNDGLARNFGLDHASGEWVLFLDDDDWWLHEYVLQQLSDRIRETTDSDIIAFAFIWRHRGYTEPRRAYYWKGGSILWPNVWSKCWRRSFIGETRFPNVKMESDLHFSKEMFPLATSLHEA